MRYEYGRTTLEEFKAAHEQNFAPLAQVIEAFCRDHGLVTSHVFDQDPSGPTACYFCGWQGTERRNYYIRVCAVDALEPDGNFHLDALGKKWFCHRQPYSSADGPEALLERLETAREILDEHYAGLIASEKSK
jgi:hypothetical protein